MRSYRSFDIPGIDMLYDSRELNTAKQAQSAVRQYGREGMLSELYGVTGWEFDFQGDINWPETGAGCPGGHGPGASSDLDFHGRKRPSGTIRLRSDTSLPGIGNIRLLRIISQD